MVPIHFDSFYPPDTRVTPSLEELETSEKDMSPFGMKRERQRVSECIERLIQLSTADGSVEPNTESPPQLWDTFMSHVCQNHGHLLHHHKDGKFCLPSPCVLVLDDNLPLRSMRYPFYQMAKKYQLGFAELCVCCEVGVAHARNHDRRIPIPNSTIINMEQRLELPEPIKHHWERRSSVLLNNCNKEEFLTSALVTAKELISEALAHPEQQMASEGSEMKETCRSENLENYLHQADIILRKCVSAAISEYTGRK
jgi:O-phosphoseryl-tRNA(Sec) kinase